MKTIVIIGSGCRCCEHEVKNFLKKTKLPFVTTWGAKDMFTHDYKGLIGSFGITGSKEGNIAVQNADVLYVFGCSLNTHHTGSNPSMFAPKADKIVVDIDNEELNKDVMKIDEKINMDLREVLEQYDLR